MADKMMRVATRGIDGKAKPLQGEAVVLGEYSSAVGRTIESGTTWTSDWFEAGGCDELTIATFLNDLDDYRVTMQSGYQELNGIRTGSTPPEIVIPVGEEKGNLSITRKLIAPRFRLTVSNYSKSDMVIGIYLYLK